MDSTVYIQTNVQKNYVFQRLAMLTIWPYLNVVYILSVSSQLVLFVLLICVCHTVEDCDNWVAVLHAAIARFQVHM